MKVLVWNNIWALQGSLETSINAFKNYLSKEANILSQCGCDVDVVLPLHLSNQVALLDKACRVLSFSLQEAFEISKTISPLESCYKTEKINNFNLSILQERLGEEYDVILLWETPVDFLKKLYPEALIISQMPGIYSRAPAQNFISLDPEGLYKNSLLTTCSNEICNYPIFDFALDFKRNREEFFKKIKFFENKVLPFLEAGKERVLLPLQVSGHFNFMADTKYGGQLEFLIEMLVKHPSKQFIVTQYITPNIKDTVLTPKTVEILKAQYPNFVYLSEFDNIASVSELLLPFVDTVCSCSSSLALQGVILGKSLIVPQNTYIKPYDYRALRDVNLTSKKVSDHLLSFLLDRYTLNFDYAISHPVFLYNLIGMLKDRQFEKGIHKLVSFNEVDPKYLDSFNEDRSGRAKKNWKNYLVDTRTTAEQMFKIIRSEDIKVVSFDIFDTLVNRPFFRPSDLFVMMNSYVKELTHGRLCNFAQIRGECERIARGSKLSKETTLSEIYIELQKLTGLSVEILELIKAREMQLEYSLCMPNKEGIKLFNYSLTYGKRIVLTTDMYLEKELIEKMLKKCGFSDYQHIYLSHEFDCSKVIDGELFKIVTKTECVEPNQILHIGDKKQNDYENAKKQGLKACRLPSVSDSLKAQDSLISALNPKKNLIRSQFFGLIANMLYYDKSKLEIKNSFTQGVPFNFGYVCFGPLILSYCLWLNHQIKSHQIKSLYFLAREGQLLERIINLINPEIRTHYLLASRRSLYGATIWSELDIHTISNLSFENGQTIRELLKSRFSLFDDDFKNFKTQFDVLINCDREGKEKLFLAALNFKEKLLLRSKQERDLYKRYLHQEDFFSEEKKAIVDIGWQGRMQSRLETITGEKLKGFYYATTLLDSDSSLDMESYVGNINSTHPSVAANYRKYLENFICAPTKSFLCFSEQNGKLCPCFIEEDDFLFRSRLITEVHEGILAFVRHFINTFGTDYHIDFTDAESILVAFLNSGKFNEIHEFEELKFMDELAGVKEKNLFVNSSKNTSDKVASPMSISKEGKLETLLIEYFATEKMKAKYYKDPEQYIRDSNSLILKTIHKFSRG